MLIKILSLYRNLRKTTRTSFCAAKMPTVAIRIAKKPLKKWQNWQTLSTNVWFDVQIKSSQSTCQSNSKWWFAWSWAKFNRRFTKASWHRTMFAKMCLVCEWLLLCLVYNKNFSFSLMRIFKQVKRSHQIRWRHSQISQISRNYAIILILSWKRSSMEQMVSPTLKSTFLTDITRSMHSF